MENESNRVIPLRTTDTIRQEVADWLVKLDNNLDSGNLSAEDLEAFRAWLAEDSRHGQILKRQAAVWRDMDIYATSPVSADTGFWRQLFAVKTLRNALAVACCGLLSVTVWLFYPDNKISVVDDAKVYATAVGIHNVKHLSDGSTVHLNTDSLLEINFTDTERRVNLVRGEALFDVAHDRVRPFIVHAQGSSVRAIGTKFVVRISSTKILVTVAEGQVQLTRQSESTSPPFPDASVEEHEESIMLSKGQVAEVSVDQTIEPVVNDVGNDELKQKFAWINGRLVFVDETLEDIVSEINRYTPIRVVIVDRELKELRLSGRFQIGDTEALLEAIEISRKDIQISHNDPGNMIYISKKPG